MIGILTYDDHLELIERAAVEGAKDIFTLRKDLASSILRLDKLCQLLEVGL